MTNNVSCVDVLSDDRVTNKRLVKERYVVYRCGSDNSCEYTSGIEMTDAQVVVYACASDDKVINK